jgi:hypothetical protein
LGVPKVLFKVSPELLLEQARECLSGLRGGVPLAALEALRVAGVDAVRLRYELEDALEQLEDARRQQLRLSDELEREREQDRLASERGFRWIQRLIARARVAIAAGADPVGDLPTRLGFRNIPRARAQGVERELARLDELLPSLLPRLEPYGVDRGFLEEGRLILSDLAQSRRLTAEVSQARKDTTQGVRAAENRLIGLLRTLAAADQAATVEYPGRPLAFPLKVLELRA